MRINDVIGILTSVYNDWSHILVNPRFIRRGSQITWDNYQPGLLKYPLLPSHILDLVDTGQYTFQVSIDGSLIQMYYQYDNSGDNIQSACLAFYSTSSSSDSVNLDMSSSFKNSLETDIGNDKFFTALSSRNSLDEIPAHSLSNEPVSWLRIDYDPVHAKGILHYDCHMHISAFPYSRLVVAGVPTPKQFIEFLIALCYPGEYEKHRLDEKGHYREKNRVTSINSQCVAFEEHEIFQQVSHFRIPSTSDGRGM